jgi:hypothetical protein
MSRSLEKTSKENERKRKARPGLMITFGVANHVEKFGIFTIHILQTHQPSKHPRPLVQSGLWG